MNPNEQYAILIWHAFFQSIHLLGQLLRGLAPELASSRPESSCRFDKTRIEIIEAIRKSKAKQLVLECLSEKENECTGKS